MAPCVTESSRMTRVSENAAGTYSKSPTIDMLVAALSVLESVRKAFRIGFVIRLTSTTATPSASQSETYAKSPLIFKSRKSRRSSLWMRTVRRSNLWYVLIFQSTHTYHLRINVLKYMTNT